MSDVKIVGNFRITSHLLGEGNFCKVYKAYGKSDPSIEAAVKVVPMENITNSNVIANIFSREVKILSSIDSNHIAKLLEFRATPKHLYIFMEFCDGGTLQDQLAKKKKFSEEEACSIIKQIASAFIDLENSKFTDKEGKKVTIMHRDIKPDNILFHKGQVKVADFGFAKPISHSKRELKRAHTICGTPLYESPQIYNEEKYSSKCDVWSTGVLFYEILFGYAPWEKNIRKLSLGDAMKVRPLNFPGTISSETKDLINKMLMVKENQRISWKDVMKHSALNKKVEMKLDLSKLVLPALRGLIMLQKETLFNNTSLSAPTSGRGARPVEQPISPLKRKSSLNDELEIDDVQINWDEHTIETEGIDESDDKTVYRLESPRTFLGKSQKPDFHFVQRHL